jgi:hypothetical protein
MKPITPQALTLILALTPPWLAAQQAPLTGRMMGGSTAVPAAPMPPMTSAPAQATPGNDAAAPVASLLPALATASHVATPAQRSEYEEPEPVQIGDTVRQLFQMQASDQRPGRRLPMLGDEASASYRRYLKSFEHEIPDFYEAKVAGDSANASAGD